MLGVKLRLVSLYTRCRSRLQIGSLPAGSCQCPFYERQMGTSYQAVVMIAISRSQQRKRTCADEGGEDREKNGRLHDAVMQVVVDLLKIFLAEVRTRGELPNIYTQPEGDFLPVCT